MQGNRRTDTRPEVRLRSALHRRGLRFRKDKAVQVGGVRVRPDVVFGRHRIAIFIDGCYWHSCPVHRSVPKTNTDFCKRKFAENLERDRRTDVSLAEAGWTVLRFWEHEDPEVVAVRIEAAVRSAT